MVIKINPARLALWRDTQTLQLGLGREAVTIENVGDAEERLINLLFRGIATESLPDVGSSLGLQAEDSESLMRRLRPALLDEAREPKGERVDSLQEEFVRQAFAEIIRASFETNLEGRDVLASRANHAVSIMQLNKTSLLLALALAAAGIGGIICNDDSPIELADTGHLGFDRSQIGKPKNLVLSEMFNKSKAPCQLIGRGEASRLAKACGLKVVVAHHPLAMADFAEFKTSGQPKGSALLAIELGVEVSRVSPVIVAGITACLDCRNLTETDRDDSWAALASQLRFRKERLDDAQTSLLCAGFALEKSLRYLDAHQPTSFEATNVDHRTGLVQLQTWQKHPGCGC